MTNLQFKFQAGTSANEREKVLAALAEDGAEVEQVFPDESDEDLAALYTAHVADDSRFATLLRRLKRSRKVAYAEQEAHRQIYLPQEVAARARGKVTDRSR